MSHHDLHLFQTNMIVKDNSAYDKGIADFFGDPARAEEFSKLVKVEDKLKMMWKAPVIQVILRIRRLKIDLNL